jgi:hypothetical protein
MKKFFYHLKIFFVPILFELTIIISQVVGEANDTHLLVYFVFTVLSMLCFIYKKFIMQVVGLLVSILIEGILVNNQKIIYNYLNNHFETILTTRNTTDNFLMCVFFQFIAFIVALLVAYGNRNNSNEEK